LRCAGDPWSIAVQRSRGGGEGGGNRVDHRRARACRTRALEHFEEDWNIVALARHRPDFPTRTRFLLLLGPLICMALGLGLGLGEERFLSFSGDVDAIILRGALIAMLAFFPGGIAAAWAPLFRRQGFIEAAPTGYRSTELRLTP
jgi:hypothetical protein